MTTIKVPFPKHLVDLDFTTAAAGGLVANIKPEFEQWLIDHGCTYDINPNRLWASIVFNADYEGHILVPDELTAVELRLTWT